MRELPVEGSCIVFWEAEASLCLLVLLILFVGGGRMGIMSSSQSPSAKIPLFLEGVSGIVLLVASRP